MKKNYISLILALCTLASLAQSPAIDSTFDPGTGFNNSNNSNIINTVYSTALQPDGKIIAGGLFSSFNGVARKNIARLNADGSLDVTFDIGDGFDQPVYSIALQADGKIIAGGDFSSFNGTRSNKIARLNADGSLDATFNLGYGFNGRVRSIAIQPDGKIIAGGNFDKFHSTVRSKIARLNADGSIDASFMATGTGIDGNVYSYVQSIALQPDGKVLAGGYFSGFNGSARSYIVRLNTDGSLDSTFNPGTGFNGTPLYSSVSSIALQPDGKIVAGGTFDDFNGTVRTNIARLNADGTLDANFNIGTGLDNTVASIALQTDGKILAGGNFQNYNGTTRYKIIRLNADASLDVTYDPSGSVSAYVRSLILQPDGKIIVGGDFIVIGTTHKRIARLLNDVTLNGINESEKETTSFTIYPNPASQLINVEFLTTLNSAEKTTIEIINSLGQTVLSNKAETKNLNIQHLQSGIYLLKVGNVTKKFIKE